MLLLGQLVKLGELLSDVRTALVDVLSDIWHHWYELLWLTRILVVPLADDGKVVVGLSEADLLAEVAMYLSDLLVDLRWRSIHAHELNLFILTWVHLWEIHTWSVLTPFSGNFL